MTYSKRCILLLILSAPAFANSRVAVTVDDLPTHGSLPPGVRREDIAKKMIDGFKKHKVPQVYGFINAGKVEERGESIEVLNQWVAAGFPIGSHTYLHEDINQVSLGEFKQSIDRNEPMLRRLGGGFNWKIFRYPFLREGNSLERRDTIRQYLKARGYGIAQVTIDFEDWSWNGPYVRCQHEKDRKSIQWLQETYLKNATDMLERAEKLATALFQKEIAHILLLHIGVFDAEMLDELLTQYEKRGVSFITLPEAMSDPIYSIDPRLPARWGSEFTLQVMKSRGLTLEDLGLSRYKGYPEDKLETVCR